MAPESFSPHSQTLPSADSQYQSPSFQIDSIHNNERVAEMRAPVSGKSFSASEIIRLLYLNTSHMKQEMIFKIGEQIIEVWWERIKLILPAGASITRVSFDETGIEMEGRLAFLTGSWRTAWDVFIAAIDKVITYGHATLTSDNREIILSKQVDQ